MEPVIYSSQDAGAPQLSMAAGALNTVIKGCLVTGYGDKPAAEWEVLHEDMATHQLAICSTSPKSIKSVLLLKNTDTKYAAVKAYTGWDSVSKTGVNEFGANVFVSIWNDNNPGWVLIATDSFFYIFISISSTSPSVRSFCCFGDARLLITGEGCSVLAANASTSYSLVGTGHKLVKTSLGADAYFSATPYPRTNAEYWGDSSSGGDYRSDIAILSRFALYQSKDGKKQPTLELPGMLMPYSEITSYIRGADNIDRLTNQHPYINPVLGMSQPYHGRVWLHTDDWG